MIAPLAQSSQGQEVAWVAYWGWDALSP
jgi:hypothetical protein